MTQYTKDEETHNLLEKVLEVLIEILEELRRHHEVVEK